MDNLKRINDLKKINLISDGHHVTIDDLYLKDENGNDYFDYIMDKNITIYNEDLCHAIGNDYNLLKRAALKGYFLQRYDNIDLLFQGPGETIIEIMFRNWNKSYSHYHCLDIYNRLFENTDDGYFFTKILDINSSVILNIIEKINDFDTLYKCLSETGHLDLMIYAKTEFLTMITPNGITMLQELINMGADLTTLRGVNNPKVADILYQNGLYKVLANINSDVLANYPSLENNYAKLLAQKQQEEHLDLGYIRSTGDNRSLAILNLEFMAKGLNPPIKPHMYAVDFFTKPTFAYMLELNRDLTLSYYASNLELKEEAIEYISKLKNIPKEDLENFELADFLSYLPKKEDVFIAIQNGQVKKLEERLVYISDLLVPMENGITLLEHMIKNNVDLKAAYGLNKNLQAVIIMIKCHYKVYSVEEDMLYEEVGNNQKLIDLLMQEGYYDCISHSNKQDTRIVEYCLKYNRIDLISNDILEELLVSRHGKLAIEKYFVNPEFVELVIKRINERFLYMDKLYLEDKKLFRLYQNGYVQFIEYCSEEFLLEEYQGMTILESLLKNNIAVLHPKREFKSLKTIELLYQYKRPDLMANASLELLMNYPSKENNYLQYILSCSSKGMDVKLEKKKFLAYNHELIARCYIELAKNSALGYAESLNDNVSLLLSKDDQNHSLLYYLLTLDRDMTLDKIISLKTKMKPEVFAELKALGVSSTPINIPFDKFDCDNICLQLNNEEYAAGIISPVEDLLKELREVFMQDGESNSKLIDALIISYRYTTTMDPMFIEEVKALIEIKKKNPQFKYVCDPNGGFFSKACGVVVENEIISTLNHETGHALHYYLTDYAIPDNFDEIIGRIRRTPQFIKKVEQYSKRYREVKKETKQKAEVVVSKYITASTVDSNNEELVALLNGEKEKIRKVYLDKGYSEETIDLIVSKSFTIEDFVEQKKTIEENELEDVIIRHDYDAFMAIGDIIDAITDGRLHSKLLKNETGETILPTCGHGIRYYTRDKMASFQEMVANYSTIIKSKHREEMLQILRAIVGDELVDLLDDFYKNKILKLSIYEDSKKVNI